MMVAILKFYCISQFFSRQIVLGEHYPVGYMISLWWCRYSKMLVRAPGWAVNVAIYRGINNNYFRAFNYCSHISVDAVKFPTQLYVCVKLLAPVVINMRRHSLVKFEWTQVLLCPLPLSFSLDLPTDRRTAILETKTAFNVISALMFISPRVLCVLIECTESNIAVTSVRHNGISLLDFWWRFRQQFRMRISNQNVSPPPTVSAFILWAGAGIAIDVGFSFTACPVIKGWKS